MGRALRKDNTGPDLKQLFVGSSGAGAILTRATLEVHVRPNQSATALVVPTSDEAVLQLLQALERDLGEYLSAFEGLSGNAMQAAIDHVPGLRNPFSPDPAPDFAVLIELETASSETYTGVDLQESLNQFLQDQFEKTIENAVIGNGHELWHLRHSISDGARAMGKPIAFDVSVPRSQIMAFRRAACELVAAEFPFLHVVDFGHIADGGVHFNVIWCSDSDQAYDDAIVMKLRDRIYAMVVQEYAGSFSAEHGVGPHNIAYYQRYTTQTERQLAQGLRQLVDPMHLCGTVSFGP
jgi:FAD/FMN-containing dehydrogenase